jgi:hypothetical protein
MKYIECFPLVQTYLIIIPPIIAGRPPLEEIMASRKRVVSWPSTQKLISS